MQTQDIPERPLLAIGLLLLAMLLFVATDGAAKYLVATMSAQQIIWVRYVVTVAVLIPVLWHQRREGAIRTRQPRLQILRGLLLMVSAMIFVLALQHLPLALCTAIGFVSPSTSPRSRFRSSGRRSASGAGPRWSSALSGSW